MDDCRRARASGQPRRAPVVRGGADGKPLIDPAYLSEDADVEVMVRGISSARELAAASAFDEWRGPEALPGEQVTDDAAVRDFVRRAAGTYYHPVGTCRMGVDAGAVVDPNSASAACKASVSPTRRSCRTSSRRTPTPRRS